MQKNQDMTLKMSQTDLLHRFWSCSRQPMMTKIGQSLLFFVLFNLVYEEILWVKQLQSYEFPYLG